METIDNDDKLFNPDIWPVPIEKPYGFLGIDRSSIDVRQIPFDYKTLERDSIIQNEFGDSLYYNGEHYRLITNDSARHLDKWFCKWKRPDEWKHIKEEEMKEPEHIDLLKLALRLCDRDIDEEIITLILKLNNLPLKSATLKDIIKVKLNNKKLYETESDN